MDLDALRARRETRRRAIRRRRLLAVSLIAAGVAVAVIVVLARGSGGGSPTAPPAARPTRPHTRVHGRLLTTGGGTSTSTTLGPLGTEPIPILLYHVIAAPPPGAPYPGLYVEPAEFAEQMQALKSAGWHAVTLDQAQAYWRHGVALGLGKPIVVSFDTGYQSQYTQALPVLRRLGWVGVENIQLSGLPPSQGGFGAGQI